LRPIRQETPLRQAPPIELRAFVISVALFAALFFIITTVSNSVVRTAADVKTLVPWINATVYFLYAIAGFVAGLVAKRRMLANGLIAGVLAAVIAIFVFDVARGDAFGITATVVNGGILGGIGGACSMLLARMKKSID